MFWHPSCAGKGLASLAERHRAAQTAPTPELRPCPPSARHFLSPSVAAAPVPRCQSLRTCCPRSYRVPLKAEITSSVLNAPIRLLPSLFLAGQESLASCHLEGKSLYLLMYYFSVGPKTNSKPNLNKEGVNATFWSTLNVPVGS